MAHKFNPKMKEKLDSPERRAVLPPKEILVQNNLHKGQTLVDIGCGTGYFTLAGAEIVGEAGKAVGLDTSAEMISHLENKILVKGYSNTHLLLSEEYADFAVLGFIFHEVDNKARFLQEIRRVLKPSGTLLILEWAKNEQLQGGPPLHHRLSMKEAADFLTSGGFEVRKNGNIGLQYYSIRGESRVSGAVSNQQ